MDEVMPVLVLVGLVVAFAVWPVLLLRAPAESRTAGFQVVIATVLLIAGLFGALWAVPLGPLAISLGNIAYAGVIMITVALFAATRDLVIVKDAVRLVIIVNVLNVVVLATTALVLSRGIAQTRVALPPVLFEVSVTSALVGGGLHLLQLLGIVVVMEQARQRLRRPGQVHAATVGIFAFALILDGALFPSLLSVLVPTSGQVVVPGLAGVGGKVVLAGLYAVPLLVFLRWSAPRAPATQDHGDRLDLRGLVFGSRRALVAQASQAAAEVEVLEDRLAGLVASITDGIVQLDRDWRFVYLNAPAREELQARAPEAATGQPEDVLGRSFFAVFPHLAAGEVEEAFRRSMATGVPGRIRSDAVLPGRVAEAGIFPSADGLTLAVRDVSEQAELEQRLRETALVEQQAAARLREVDRLKTAFLTAVSHELRTPLTVVDGLAQTLQRVRDDRLAGPAREAVEDRLVANARRLTDLLDDLLDIDRMARGASSIDPRRTDLSEVVATGVAMSRRPDRIVVEAPDELWFDADAVRVERIVANLLDNADKYAPDGTVRVTLARIGPRVRLTVADEGPGVAAGAREQVFDAFTRLDDEHPQPGTGIGLALVREFARLHGGDAWIAPSPTGTTVVVELADQSGAP